MTEPLRAVVASPLGEEYCQLIERLEPRLRVIREGELLPPQRDLGDHEGDPSFRRSVADQARFEALVDSADVLYGLPDESPAALQRAVRQNPQLRWVHSTKAGGGAAVRAAELNEEELSRVAFSTSAGVHVEPLAEFVLFGLLAGAKSLPWLDSAKHDRRWPEKRLAMRLLSEMTVLVVGLGSIGQVTATKLSNLGVEVVGVHRRNIAVPGVARVVPVESLAHEAATADAIVMTLPGTELTHHMLDAAVLEHAKPGIIVINVGRGVTIDEVALVAALQDGRVGFAALDVFEVEPLPKDSELWSFDNVIVSPHTAALNASEDRLIAELFAANATRLMDGLPLINRVNTVEFY